MRRESGKSIYNTVCIQCSTFACEIHQNRFRVVRFFNTFNLVRNIISFALCVYLLCKYMYTGTQCSVHIYFLLNIHSKSMSLFHFVWHKTRIHPHILILFCFFATLTCFYLILRLLHLNKCTLYILLFI